jgi:4-hydroxy-2-oxoheptanedioate aldolase
MPFQAIHGAVTSELNPIRRAWAEQRPAFGVFLAISSPYSVELCASAGVDYVCIDMQHGLSSYESLPTEIAACRSGGAAPIVRPAANEFWQIGRALDLGALGVLVPLVSSPDEAAAAVSACRYGTAGRRSYGPTLISRVVGSSDPSTLEREALCIVMIETLEGLENVEQIAAVPGLDGIYYGPADLAISLDVAPAEAAASRAHAEAIERIRQAAASNGIAAGAHCNTGAQARERADQGFTLITVTSDARALSVGVEQELQAARTQTRS